MRIRIKRFKLDEIWVLLRWILIFEVALVVFIALLNFFFNLRELYKTITITNFVSFGIFSFFIIFFIEILSLSQLYLNWLKKFGHIDLTKKDLIKKMLTQGENKKIEFKKSLRWDYEKNEFNKELEKSVLKTIAGFLNAEGGNIIIGVTDKKEIVGLGKDYLTLPKKNKDGFENYMTQIIRSNIGSQSLRLISADFSKLENKDICSVRVKPSEDPVFSKINGDEEFFVRVGNSTASLSISEAVSYIKNHWKIESDEVMKNK